jgi:hypothetical protein
MKTTKDATKGEKMVARAFCEFLYEVPVGTTFTLWNLQGALRFANRAVPATQGYAEHLRIATEAGYVEPVPGKADTYKRLGPVTPQRSAHARAELQVLKDRIICALESREWID